MFSSKTKCWRQKERTLALTRHPGGP
uniref:Uncharacterized protein n=1 Tax=Arundo donax TaxID=35708 RepID=A0A0A9FKK3_ARUDO